MSLSEERCPVPGSFDFDNIETTYPTHGRSYERTLPLPSASSPVYTAPDAPVLNSSVNEKISAWSPQQLSNYVRHLQEFSELMTSDTAEFIDRFKVSGRDFIHLSSADIEIISNNSPGIMQALLRLQSTSSSSMPHTIPRSHLRLPSISEIFPGLVQKPDVPQSSSAHPHDVTDSDLSSVVNHAQSTAVDRPTYGAHTRTRETASIQDDEISPSSHIARENPTQSPPVIGLLTLPRSISDFGLTNEEGESSATTSLADCSNFSAPVSSADVDRNVDSEISSNSEREHAALIIDDSPRNANSYAQFSTYSQNSPSPRELPALVLSDVTLRAELSDYCSPTSDDQSPKQSHSTTILSRNTDRTLFPRDHIDDRPPRSSLSHKQLGKQRQSDHMDRGGYPPVEQPVDLRVDRENEHRKTGRSARKPDQRSRLQTQRGLQIESTPIRTEDTDASPIPAIAETVFIW